MSNKLTVQINGIKYAITTSEELPYVQSLAREIDALVTGLMKNSSMSMDQAMLLAALNYVDLYKKAEQNADNLRAQVAEYAEDAAKARMELTEARKDLSKGGQGKSHDKRNG